MATRAFISGCASLSLSDEEKSFFSEADPWGFILFRRNVASPDQVRGLVHELRSCVGRTDAPVLIDQEGGRVQRLSAPHWPAFPPARRFGALYARDPEQALALCGIGARLIAEDLRDLGITVDCLPVLDVPIAGAHDVIGDRAYSDDPRVVAALGRVAAEGLIAGGVLPVFKHVPGHGRAMVDSHLSLPVVETTRAELRIRDFEPFRALSDLPAAMTAHVVYRSIDPSAPATTSRTVVEDVIRREIGFDGLLMSDDLSMKALRGSFEERTSACFAAGVDMALHCNGNLDEARAVASQTPLLSGKAARRAEAALARIAHRREPIDRAELRAKLDLGLGSGVEV